MAVHTGVKLFSMKNFSEKYFPWILLVLITVTLVILTLTSEGYTGGADNINHYFLSRFAWKYPLHFFDPWGRPVYTILSFPFAQLGFMSVKLLNVFFGMCTAYIAYLIAKRLDIRPSYLVMIFVVFTPLYCVMLPTALTEILFGLILILAVYLFFGGHFIASAIVLSFLPFTRSEGIIMFPIFFLAYLLKGKIKPIPFLLTGFVVLSLTGSYVYKDLFWIINNPAYPIHHPIYKDKGPLLHFYNNLYFIFGTVMKYLFLLGTLWLLFRLYMTKWSFRTDVFFAILLIWVPFAGYFVTHSFLYWKALGGSIGLVRVIAAVLPLAAIIALMGFQWIIQLFFKHKWQQVSLVLIISILVIIGCFRIYPFPVKLSPEEELIRKATGWVKAEGLGHGKIIFNDLNVPFNMDLDPNDGAVCAQKWFVDHKDPAPDMPDSAVFIWDSHFGPNECQVPLDSLMLNPHYKLINRFLPGGDLKTLGGYNYEVNVFLRLPQGETSDNTAQLELLKQAEEKNMQVLYSKTLDFEDAGKGADSVHCTRKTAYSGTFSYVVGNNEEFTPGFHIQSAALQGKKEGLQVRVSVAVFTENSFGDNPADLVISLENNKGSYQYASYPLDKEAPLAGQWNNVSVSVFIPEIKADGDLFKIYIWHRGKQPFMMDLMKADVLVRK